MAAKSKPQCLLMLLPALVFASALCAQNALANPPVEYGTYYGNKGKTAEDPRKGFLFATLHKNDKLEGKSEGVFVMPPGSYCGQDGEYTFVLREPTECPYRLSFEGNITRSSGRFSATVKGEFITAPFWPISAAKGGKRVGFPLEGVFKGKAQDGELEGDLVLSSRACGVGAWLRKGSPTSTVRPGGKDENLIFAAKAQSGDLSVDTTQKIRKTADGPISYIKHRARFTWKTKKHQNGGLVPWRYLEGEASIYTKNGYINAGGRVSSASGCLYWKLCGKRLDRISLIDGSWVSADYCLSRNEDGKTRTGKLKTAVPDWWQYHEHCKGAGGISLVTRLDDGYGGWASYTESFRWQPSGRNKELVQVDKVHYKAELQKTNIKVCPRLNPDQAGPPVALIYAHPDFPALLEMALSPAHSVAFSLPPGSPGTLSPGGASKATKGPLKFKAGNVHFKSVTAFYRYGSQPSKPLTEAITDVVKVKIFDSSQKLVEEQEVVIKVGLGLYLDRFKLFQAAPEDKLIKRVEHAFLLTLKSRLNPGLDLEWYQDECDSCRQSSGDPRVGSQMPGAVRLHLMAGWFNNSGLPTTQKELKTFNGQLQVAKTKPKGTFQMAPGRPHWQQEKAYSGPIWCRKKGEEVTIYPAIDQYKQGYFVIQARTRPLLDGKMISLTESSLDQYKYFMAAYDSPESLYQSLACVLQPRNLSQLVQLETLKLIPAFGGKVKWWLLLPAKVICLLSQGKEDEAFLALMKAGAEKFVEVVVFKCCTPGMLRSLCKKYNLPNITDEDIQSMNSALKKAFKIAKSKYKIWSKSGKLPPKKIVPKLPKQKQPPKQNMDGRQPETEPPAEQDITSELLGGMNN